MKLAEFLEMFFGRLAAKGIRFCVLRNYRGLPEANIGGDIDVLLEPRDLGMALLVLRSVPGIDLTDIARRPYVVSTFFSGVDGECMQLDLFTAMSWRGISFLGTAGVLDRVRQHPSCAWIPIPEPIDEAIISFATSFLIGGFIKQRYSEVFVPAFRNHEQAVEDRLAGAVAPSVLRPLLIHVANGQSDGALTYVESFRRSLFVRAIVRRPVAVIVGALRHYWTELAVHVASSNLCTVAVFGPDGAGKTAVIGATVPRLTGCTKIVEARHLRPNLPRWRAQVRTASPVEDPHGRPAKSTIASIAQLLLWFTVYWYDRWVRRKRNATLRIYDRYFHDVLVDPRRYRYGGPPWFARVVSRLVPQPDLVIVLDAPPEVLHGRKREVSFEETERQRTAYLDLAGTLRNAHVLDAAQPLEEVVNNVGRIVLCFMKERTARRLPTHDPQTPDSCDCRGAADGP
jgi:thymidylate kinase